MSLAHKDENELLREYLRHRDIELLGQLFNPYISLVYGVALKFLQDGDDAQDAVMDIFEKLHKRSINPEINNFKAYLYTACRNHCYEELRRRNVLLKKEKEHSFMHSDQIVHLDDVESEEELRKLETCIAQLDLSQRECIKMFYYQKKSYQEIGELLQINFNQVRSKIQNGRRNLKLCIESLANNRI